MKEHQRRQRHIIRWMFGYNKPRLGSLGCKNYYVILDGMVYVVAFVAIVKEAQTRQLYFVVYYACTGWISESLACTGLLLFESVCRMDREDLCGLSYVMTSR